MKNRMAKLRGEIVSSQIQFYDLLKSLSFEIFERHHDQWNKLGTLAAELNLHQDILTSKRVDEIEKEFKSLCIYLDDNTW